MIGSLSPSRHRLRDRDSGHPNHPNHPNQQKGVALLTALLIVAIATSTAIAIAARQHLEIRQTANLLGRDQAYMIALGGEFWAKQVLIEDRQNNKTDTLTELWASQPAAIAVQGGSIKGRIHDQQALFNLNTLVDSNNKQNPLAMGRFQRLLEQQHQDPALALAVADWIDKNQTINGSGGAEDETYMSSDPPYLTANHPMLSVSELALIKGFSPQTIETLLPWVTVLPKHTPINVNTAPVEILQILAPGLSLIDAQLLANSRQEQGYSSVDDFKRHPVLQNIKLNPDGLSVASEYFRASIYAQVGRGHVQLYSLLGRTKNKTVLLRRRLTVD